MKPNLNTIFTEYTFDLKEAIQARILTDLQLGWIQTARSKIYNELATMPASPGLDTDRDYFLKKAELQGMAGVYTHLIDDHFAAIKELNDPNSDTSENAASAGSAEAIAQRAASLVDKG